MCRVCTPEIISVVSILCRCIAYTGGWRSASCRRNCGERRGLLKHEDKMTSLPDKTKTIFTLVCVFAYNNPSIFFNKIFPFHFHEFGILAGQINTNTNNNIYVNNLINVIYNNDIRPMCGLYKQHMYGFNIPIQIQDL